MKATELMVRILRILFGVVGLVACVALFFSLFMIATPRSTNVWTVNLAIAPLIYLALYALSLAPPNGSNGRAPTLGARMFRALMPMIGIAWYGLAWLALDKVCGGNFSC